MYKIVFLDDEPWALRDIGSIVAWEKMGFGQIWSFTNSMEALECILREKPDVVCTDVRMPDLSGIDLIRRCKAECPETLFVVVSAYAEFEYVRTLMECGAFAYILKPLEEEEILSLVERLKNTLSNQTRQILSEKLRSLTIHTIFGYDRVPDEDLALLSSIASRPFQVCISQSIPADSANMWFQIYDDLSVSLSAKASYLPKSILCGRSKTETRLDFLPERLREALIAFYTMRFYHIKQGSFDYNEQENWMIDEIQLIVDSWKGNNIKKVSEALNQVKASAVCSHYSIEYLTLFYNNLLRILINQYPQTDLQAELHEFSSCFRMYGVMHNIDTLFDNIFILFENCLGKDDERTNTRNVVLSVIKYVDQHYMEPLTLEQMTEQFNISLSYLCRCFKRETGCSFITYLKQRRLERACELLVRSDLTVTEIGLQTGFTDYCYFTKVFKKNMGCSPSQYRTDSLNK